MTNQSIVHPGPIELRLRAGERLTGRQDPAGESLSASAALGVLHELASSPDTAADALALLHELQVHQVELELQAEELRNARTELEAELEHRHRLYDDAAAGLFDLDADTVMAEINLAGAQLLDARREAVIGHPLADFLTAESAATLGAMVRRGIGGGGADSAQLKLVGASGTPKLVQARVGEALRTGCLPVALLELHPTA